MTITPISVCVCVCYYSELYNAKIISRECNILPKTSHLCSIMSKQSIKLSLAQIELISKKLFAPCNPKKWHTTNWDH